ncbi:hypothetical protein ABZ312_23630 [Streptomyces sp. NPDC006207]
MSAGRATATLAASAMGVIAISLAISGCDNTSTSTSRSAASATKSPSDQSEGVEGESVTRAPEAPDGEVLTQVASVSGNRILNLPGGLSKAPLGIAVNCKGKGTLKVSVEPVALSFPLECVDGEVSSTYNEIQLKRPRAEGAVHVEAPSSVHWSMTIAQ